jgi:COP9 signalosome complex subunit 2
VTRNYSEKSINNILDYASTADNMTFMEAFYEVTLESLVEMKNERLWVKTNLKLAKLWLDRKEYGRLSKVRKDMSLECPTDRRFVDTSSTTYSLSKG